MWHFIDDVQVNSLLDYNALALEEHKNKKIYSLYLFRVFSPPLKLHYGSI